MTTNKQPGLNRIKEILSESFPYTWTQPPEIKMGVLTTNQAFKIAQDQGVSPVEAAKDLQNKIQEFINKNELGLDVKTVGPYLNLHLSTTYQNQFFLAKNYTPDLPQNNSTLLEFFSPNVGKQMHIGHMRGGNLGEATRRILSLTNNKLITNNHLGDWGIQFGILIWGVLNLNKLGLDFQTIDWDTETNYDLISKINQIYVSTNNLIEYNVGFKTETQNITKLLETNLEEEKNNSTEIFNTWKSIIQTSLINYSSGEAYLGLNKDNSIDSQLFSQDVHNSLKDMFGVWQINSIHKSGQFDLVIGESFYQHFLDEIHYWVEQGLAVQEGESIYIDLEDEKLGRCYLISSGGYSIYAARDIIARFIWAGLFDVDYLITYADNRQSHSFSQVFAIIQRIIDSGIYNEKPFGILSSDQTKKALKSLQSQPPIHNKYGFISLPEGAMSSRKGTVILLQDFISDIEKAVKNNLETKSKTELRSVADNQKIQKISAAVIKWYDLATDREQDYIFDINQAVQFEGNTGIYQLYTLARLKNILRKNETTNQLGNNSFQLLNGIEKDLLQKMIIIEPLLLDISANYKPHHLCNYLFELATMANSWYTKHSVSMEQDTDRKDALLHLVTRLINHLEFCLNLLAIETVENL